MTSSSLTRLTLLVLTPLPTMLLLNKATALITLILFYYVTQSDSFCFKIVYVRCHCYLLTTTTEATTTEATTTEATTTEATTTEATTTEATTTEATTTTTGTAKFRNELRIETLAFVL